MAEEHAAAGPDGTPVTPAAPAASPPASPGTSGPDQPHAGAEAAGSPAPGAAADTGLQPRARDGRAWRGDWQITVVVAALILGLVLYITQCGRALSA